MEMENGAGSGEGNSGNRVCSPRFTGVFTSRNGEWGARIYYHYKRYGIGTYQLEEEAAMAYDRAAIKLHRGDARLNFPVTNYTAEEKEFQSLYSEHQVIVMLKDKTYEPKYTSFLSFRALRNSNPQKGQISSQLLFEKELTDTDVSTFDGLSIPEEHAMAYFTPSVETGETRDLGEFTFYDKQKCPWTFRYSYWSNTQSYVFTKGWGFFVKMKNLSPGDVVGFYRCEFEAEGGRQWFYGIDIRRNGAAEQGNGAGVKLFGVWIN